MIFSGMIVHHKKILSLFSKLDKLGKIRKQYIKCNSSLSSSKVLEHLKNKSLLRIRGKEANSFLQGLITNDMKHFENGAANLYALFLNIKGRVLYDCIIYRSQETDMYYIECDSQVVDSLQKHLRMYCVRRKIDIDSLNDSVKVWAFFDPVQSTNNRGIDDRQNLEGLIFPCGALNNKASRVIDDIMIYEDPRLSSLGIRILAESNIKKMKILKYLNYDVAESTDNLSYRAFRYKIGVSEGVEDLPPGKALPLEVNCDYMHGVNFHKGCYIGQELTARTYHTGVVRKRLMPLLFDEIPTKAFLYDDKIVNESGTVVGKFRGIENKYGLGLMRIAESLNAKSLSISNVKLQKVVKPFWWPQEQRAESVVRKKE